MQPIINISTPKVFSSIGIIRISFGCLNKKIIYFLSKKLFYKILKPRIVNNVFFYDFENYLLDKGILIYFNKPNSYTGEDVFEYQGHGNPFILNLILKNFIFILRKYKLRLSKKGEFTKRSFNNKKLDIFELNSILKIFDYENIFFLKNENFFPIINFKKLIEKIKISLEKIYLLNFRFLNFYNKKKFNKKILYLFKYLKKKIFFILKKFNFKNKYKNSIIILGFVNSGKSTFTNNICNDKTSITSNIPGTTRELIRKNFYLKNLKFNIYDTSGLNNCKNILEYISIIFAIKKKSVSNIIIYIFSNILIYNIFFYYIKKNIKKFQLFIKIVNKSDFYLYKIYFEIFILKNKKNLFFTVSSKKKCGFLFIIIEIKRNFYIFNKSFSNIFLKILKKSYNYLNKSYIFFIKKKYIYYKNNILKTKKYINFIINVKNKTFLNKIFKKLCIGK